MPKFPGEIYVYDMDNLRPASRPVYTCDTTEQASDWIEDYGLDGVEYTIDGTPRAWYEQTGECGCLKGETCEGCRPDLTA